MKIKELFESISIEEMTQEIDTTGDPALERSSDILFSDDSGYTRLNTTINGFCIYELIQNRNVFYLIKDERNQNSIQKVASIICKRFDPAEPSIMIDKVFVYAEYRMQGVFKSFIEFLLSFKNMKFIENGSEHSSGTIATLLSVSKIHHVFWYNRNTKEQEPYNIETNKLYYTRRFMLHDPWMVIIEK